MKKKIRWIFDMQSKLYFRLDTQPEIRVLKRIYCCWWQLPHIHSVLLLMSCQNHVIVARFAHSFKKEDTRWCYCVLDCVPQIVSMHFQTGWCKVFTRLKGIDKNNRIKPRSYRSQKLPKSGSHFMPCPFTDPKISKNQMDMVIYKLLWKWDLTILMKKTNALFVITSILASSFILKCFYQDSSTRYKITGGHSHQFFRQEIVSGVASTCHIVFQFSPFTCCCSVEWAQVWICFASDQANDTTSSSNCCSQPEISRLNSQLAFTSDFPETLVVLINYSQTYLFYTYILGLPSFIRPVNGEWLWWWTYHFTLT